MKKNSFFLILFLLFIIWIFRSWFSGGVISSGDLRIFFPSSFKDYYLFPYAWDWQQLNGLGGFASPFAWLTYDLNIPLITGNYFQFSWQTIERLFYLFPFLVICVVSPTYLSKKIFPRNPFYLFTAFLYLFNTYILMMVGGGQIVGISLAYAIFPLVLAQFMLLSDMQYSSRSVRYALLTGLLFALLIFFDLRFAYMLLIAVLVYFLFDVKNAWKKIFLILIIPVGSALLLHFFWILPVLVLHQNPALELGSSYNSLSSVIYFSFAKFENSISLLHPNWPENIFGKVSFMKPEFLVLPILAFASLLFVSKKDKKETHFILFFVLLGLIGAFLAKGANEPFGGVYLWMFQHFLGFNIFRDSTKWYTLVALSYSVLIPFTLWNIFEWFVEKSKIKNQKSYINIKLQKFIPHIFVLAVILYLLFLIRPAVVGQLEGTFKPVTVPSDYVSFAKFLSIQQQFSRTLWVPATQRFGFSSQNHPAISAQDLFNIYNEKELLKNLDKPVTERILRETGVKYVIVPIDSQKEIFLNDRIYSDALYTQTVADISKISWLKRESTFSNLVVFEVADAKDHFWSPSSKLKVKYTDINPTKYMVAVTNARKGDKLIFAENFDKNWVANFTSEPNSQQSSIPYDKLFNSFILPKNGNYTVEVTFAPQKWVNIGLAISLATFISVLGSLIVLKRREQ